MEQSGILYDCVKFNVYCSCNKPRLLDQDVAYHMHKELEFQFFYKSFQPVITKINIIFKHKFQVTNNIGCRHDFEEQILKVWLVLYLFFGTR